MAAKTAEANPTPIQSPIVSVVDMWDGEVLTGMPCAALGGRCTPSFCGDSGLSLLFGGDRVEDVMKVVCEDDDMTLLLVTRVDDWIGVELFVNLRSRRGERRCRGVGSCVGSGLCWPS